MGVNLLTSGLIRVTGDVSGGTGGLEPARQINARARNINFPGIPLLETDEQDGYRISQTDVDGVGKHEVTFSVLGGTDLPKLVNKEGTLLSYLVTTSTNESAGAGIPGTRQQFLGGRGVLLEASWASHSPGDDNILTTCRFLINRHFRWLERLYSNNDGGDWQVFQEGIYGKVVEGTKTRNRGAWRGGRLGQNATLDNNESTVSPFRLMNEALQATPPQESMLTGIANSGYVWETKKAV